MPFSKLSPSAHKCPLPERREDGSKLQIGDEWWCSEKIDVIVPSTNGAKTTRMCKKKYRYSSSQHDGNYWHHIGDVETREISTNYASSFAQQRDGSDYVGPYGVGPEPYT